jgi:type II secretory ATPase GspE/PulE/Tfp pilus assembly ATPase PilB-like protein
MMVGEMRDKETAEIGIRSAMTGHLVFSTLHTNDAPSAVVRMVDMGVEPYLAAASLECIIAQRLVRQICTQCRVKDEAPQTALPAALAVKNMSFFKGKGCEQCSQTGFFGRVAIHEVLVMDDNLRDAITQKIFLTSFRQEAVRRGMVQLVHDGLDKVNQGITTVSEVIQYA